MRDQIFISYSHSDSFHQLRLRKHLAAFERADNIQYWSDTQLKTGDLWRQEIDNNLHKTAVAILLISADFLDSDFIRSNELPPLLDAWKKSGVHILPVIVKPCNFTHIKDLSRFQAINDPQKTIEEMAPAEQERTWANLSQIAYDRLQTYQEQHNEEDSTAASALPGKLYAELPDQQYTGVYSPDCAINAGEKKHCSVQVCGEDQEGSDTFCLRAFETDIAKEYSSNKISPNYVHQEDYLIYDYMNDLFSNPKQLQSYYVYTYEHIDILDFLPPAKGLLGKYAGYNDLIFQVKQLFYQKGWDGDGTIRLMWFPPFLKIGIEDTWGTLAWFVKQNNNGTAFIASPVRIPYLQENTPVLSPDADGFYTAQIAEVRAKIRPGFRCFKIRGLLDLIPQYVADESHWLLYHTGDFKDPMVNDWVRFQVKEIRNLRNFPDIKNTRNIYLHALDIL